MTGWARVAPIAGLLLLAACDDPLAITWYALPETIVLYSMASPTSGLPNAMDFIYGTRWLVESPDASGNWDVAIDSDGDGFRLMPPGALGITSDAAVWTMVGASFDDLTVAPADTSAYVRDEPVPLTFGNAYVIRTREVIDGNGLTCNYYVKAELVAADPANYRVDLLFDINPRCDDRGLVPDDETG